MRFTVPLLALLVVVMPALAQKRSFEYTRSMLGGVQYYLINDGVFGFDVTDSNNGLVYPRGSSNSYLFGSGLWFGAEKERGDSLIPLAFITYNPNTGAGWAVPGESLPGENLGEGLLGLSTAVDRRTGEASVPNRPNWPLWQAGLTTPTFLSPGRYVRDTTDRVLDARVKSPAFVPGPDEEIVSRFCDIDLDRYEYGATQAHTYGFPLYLQIQQNVYGWSTGPLESTVLLQYELVNIGQNTLHDCYIGQLTDPDIGQLSNDFSAWIDADTTLRASAVWTRTESTPYGMLLITGIETPTVRTEDSSVDNTRRDRYDAQLGVTGARLISIAEEFRTPRQIYGMLRQHRYDSTTVQTDVRELHSSGPFNLGSLDTVHFAIAYTIVNESWPLSVDALRRIGTMLKAIRTAYYGTTELGVTTMNRSAGEEPTISTTPTPASTSIEIAGTFPGTSSATLRLIDRLGRTVAPSRPVPVTAGRFAARMDVGALPSGLYIAIIEGNGEIRSAKVLVAR